MTNPLVPTRDSNGKLLCPRCATELKDQKAPYFIAREYLGEFDSKFCDMCQYSLLTAYGYDAALKEANKYGIVGPEEELVSEQFVIDEKADLTPIQYIWQLVRETKTLDDKLQIINLYQSKVKGHSKSYDNVLLILEPNNNSQITRKQIVVVKTI